MSKRKNMNRSAGTNIESNRAARPRRRTVAPSQPPVTHEEAPSDTRPAEEIPSLDTLGSLSSEKLEDYDECDLEQEYQQGFVPDTLKELERNLLPNVPNTDFDGPNACSNVSDDADRRRLSEEQDECDSDLSAFRSAFTSIPVRGVFRVGVMTHPRNTFEHRENPDLGEILTEVVDADTVIEAAGEVELSVVDVDVHHWPTPPGDEELEMHLAAIRPLPEAAWISHGRGLKLIYVGSFHRERALAAAFCIPASMHVELLDHTRHPMSTSTQHEGATCGPVNFYDTDPEQPYLFRNVGPPTRELRDEALRRWGLVGAMRFDHDRCPIDPGADSDAEGCVVVIDRGVFCYRCASHGVATSRTGRPGFLPYASDAAEALGELDRLAEHRIHWTQARLELRHFFANLSEPLLGEAYRLALEEVYGMADPRISLIFNKDLDFVWGGGHWLDSVEYHPTVLDNDACATLPYVLDVRRDKEGQLAALPNPARRSKVKSRTPVGYSPIRPVYGISFAEDAVGIPTPRAPLPRFPVELLSNPLPESDAMSQISTAFPRVNPGYLYAALAAAICGEARLGQPPMLACTGPSGSGKEQHLRLVASFLGDDVVKLPLCDDVEAFKRHLGIAVSGGHRFIVFDELSKDPRLSERLQNLLQIATRVNWRPLYANRQVDTEMRAAVYYPCINFPEFLANSQEFNRRCRLVELHCRVPNWAETSGGDTCAWRNVAAENAHVANSVLTHVWLLCREHGFQFGAVADHYGLGRLSDDAPGLDPEHLRALYQHARNEDGRRVLFVGDTSFRGEWVDLGSPAAQTLIQPFLPDGGEHGLRRSREIAKANLEAQSWPDILKIDDPSIICKVKIHGNKWGLKFQSAAPALKGRELRNEQLPPLRAGGNRRVALETNVTVVNAAEGGQEVVVPSSSATTQDAEDTLRKGGFPV